jgi:hypothetical protein
MRVLEKLFYITIDNKKIEILNVKRNVRAEKDLTTLEMNPFAHHRVIVDDISLAEKLIAETLRQTLKSFSDRLVKPTIVFHSMRDFGHDITQMEKYALTHLLIRMGARKVIFWSGEELSREEVLEFVESQ